jgi:hypothetical protein
LIVAHDHPFEGAAPFFIHWGATPHPTLRLPPQAHLARFVVRHPLGADLLAWWTTLGGAVGPDEPVFEVAATPSLHASFEGPHGPWALDGEPVAITLGGRPS